MTAEASTTRQGLEAGAARVPQRDAGVKSTTATRIEGLFSRLVGRHEACNHRRSMRSRPWHWTTAAFAAGILLGRIAVAQPPASEEPEPIVIEVVTTVESFDPPIPPWLGAVITPDQVRE
jgi:hypothetical protein